MWQSLSGGKKAERVNGTARQLKPLLVLVVDVANEGELEAPGTNMRGQISGGRVPFSHHGSDRGGLVLLALEGQGQRVRIHVIVPARKDVVGYIPIVPICAAAPSVAVVVCLLVAGRLVENDLEADQCRQRPCGQGTQRLERTGV